MSGWAGWGPGGRRARAGRPDPVYLSDFGLSKQMTSATGPTRAGQFLGTLDYIAPEQLEGGPVDGRADQYALACAAFELLGPGGSATTCSWPRACSGIS